MGITTNVEQDTFVCRRKKTFFGLAATLSLAVFSPQSAATSDPDYFENALLNPSGVLLRAESRGRITIYDGLDSQLVEAALDNQFERIGSMMFVRVQHDLTDGSVEIEDDCD